MDRRPVTVPIEPSVGHDQLAPDELDRLAVLEGAEIHEALVFHASPAAKRERCLLHDGSVARGASSVNRRRFDTLPSRRRPAHGDARTRRRIQRDGLLTVWTAAQAHQIRQFICEVQGLEAHRVRVIAPTSAAASAPS
jgi:hypothetical protein